MNRFDELLPFTDTSLKETGAKPSYFPYQIESYNPFNDSGVSGTEHEAYNLKESAQFNEAGLQIEQRIEPEIEGELSNNELETAMQLNAGYMMSLRWVNYVDVIINLLKNKVGINAKTPSGTVRYDLLTQAIEKYQQIKGLQPTNKGALAIGTWAAIQDDLGFLKITKPFRINIYKAARLNKKYEAELWGNQVKAILKLFTSLGIIKDELPLDSKYFALAVAEWQKEQIPKHPNLKADGALGPATWGIMEKDIEALPAPVIKVKSKWHDVIPNAVQSPAEFLVDGKETFASMVSAIRKADKGDFICILGWMLNIDFPLVPDDPGSTLYNLLQEASRKEVSIRILIWQNNFETERLRDAKERINKITNAVMLTDNATFGSPLVAFLSGQIKSKMNLIPFPMSKVLDAIPKWREIKEYVSQPNEGSHHEKVLIVKNKKNLVAFCGGVDINPNRLKTHYDAHCKVEGHAAWELLQRFKQRWEAYASHSNPDYLHILAALFAIRPASTSVTGNPYVKIFHTYNHPNGKSRDRSIHDTLKKAIAKAQKSVYMEDQYMVSCEIAGWLNEKLKADQNFKVTIVTQHDEFAKEDMRIPKRKRGEFIRKLGDKILNPANLQIKILDETKSAPLKYVHSKIYIIDEEDDGLAIIGSANCNRRSMLNDSETAAFIFNDINSGNFVRKFKEKVSINHPEKYNDDYRNPRLPNTVKDLDEELINQIDSIPLPLQILAGPLTSIGVKSAAKAAVIGIMDPLWEVIDPNPDNIKCDIPGTTDFEIDGNEELLNREISSYTPFTDQETIFDTVDFRSAEVIEHEPSISDSPKAKTCEGLYCWAKTVLNSLLNLNLSLSNNLDEATKKAIGDFQVKNNLPQTKKIDPATERALLECDAILKSKGTSNESEVTNIILSAKDKIEDWTKQAVVVKKEITNSYRDPRKVWAFVLHHMAFKRRNKTGQLSDPKSYLKTGAHFCIMMDGRIIQLHQFSRMIWHGNCLSPRSVAVEFEGNFPNIKGRWWIDKESTVQNKDVPTQAQYDSGKFLAGYLKVVLGTKSIFAHRQSSDQRENDPGPDIWYNVGQWAIDNLGMTDGGPTFKCGTGNPILSEWRTWGNKISTLIKKEADQIDIESTEWDDELITMESVEPEGDYENEESDYHETFEIDDEPDNRHYSDEFIETELDLPKAVRLNRYYGETLGWNQYYDRINDLILPYSGLQNVSLGEEVFAQAVSSWQKSQGFPEIDSDGIMGPVTWQRMKKNLGLDIPAPLQSKSSKDSTASKILQYTGIIEKYSVLNKINPNIVRGIIAAESGGNYRAGEGGSGYKGLMQAGRTADQLKPEISIKTGIEKFISFRNTTLNPWLTKLGINIPAEDNENYLKAALSCYNAGPVTALKAIQFANAAGNWQQWLSPEHYKRALLFSGGYAQYSTCNKDVSKTGLDKARAQRLKYRFKTSSWQTEPDPPEWNNVYLSLNPVMRCWIETKFRNTPGYLDKFIKYFKYFEANPEAKEPGVETEITELEEKSYSDQEAELIFENDTDHYEIAGETVEQEDENSFTEINELVTDWSKAVRLNRYYADQLGWNQFHDQINDLLLPYSGMQNVSLGEEAFAQAVAAWQARQGFSAIDCDGIIGTNTWSRLKPLLSTPSYYPKPKAPIVSPEPSAQNILEFNKWHAEKILDSMNSGIVGTNFNSKDQLENIVNGRQVFNVNPNTRIIQALPVISHITENAKSENYRDIVIGSFIRTPDSSGKCTGHCEGRCIDINIRSGSFESSDSTQMVIMILQYLKGMSEKYKKSIGFGMPLQGDFFGRQNLQKFKSVDPSLLLNPELSKLVFDLGIVFPDNNNHLHIQVKWITEEAKLKHEDLEKEKFGDEDLYYDEREEKVFEDEYENFDKEQEKVIENPPDMLLKNIQNPDQPVILARAEAIPGFSNEMHTFYKMYDKINQKFIGEIFDEQGNKVTLSDIRIKENELSENVNNKIHPALQKEILKTAETSPVDIAVWLNLEVKEPLKTNYRPEELTNMPAEIADYRKKLASAIEETVRKVTIERSGIQVQRVSDLLPLFFAKATKRTIDLIKNDPLVLGIFYNDRSYFESLDTSLSRSGAAEAQTAGMTNLGKEIKVAVWENAPDLLTNLTIEGYYDAATPNVSNHSRLVSAIIKNKESGKSKGYAPNCKLYSANLSGSDVFAPLEWAAKQGCTVINRSFHQDTDQVNAGMQLSDFITDALALQYPYPVIVQAAGNTGQPDDTALGITPAGNEYVNHKGYNSIAVGSHDEQTERKISGFSTFRNPSSPHNDREMPEICALGENISAVGLTNWGGTSFASPAVAGAAALLQSLSPVIKFYPEVTRALLLTGSKRNVDGGLWYKDLKQTPKVDQKDGTGALNIYESITIAKKPYQPRKVALDKGWDYGKLDASSFGPNKISTREWKIKVPQNKKHVKITLAWNSNANYTEIWKFKFLKDTTLDMDLDILVYDDKNTFVATSSSFDNSFEIADYIAKGGEILTVKIRGYSIKPNAWSYFGLAWTTF